MPPKAVGDPEFVAAPIHGDLWMLCGQALTFLAMEVLIIKDPAGSAIRHERRIHRNRGALLGEP
jgi:hypothetical protein